MSAARTRPLDSRILLIAYHFPPSAAVGGLRLSNFARCLRAFGGEAHVLTVRERDIDQIDRSRERGLDGITVHRSRVLPTIERMYEGIVKRARGSRRRSNAAAQPVAVATSPNGERTVSRPSRIKRWILSFLALPDRERGWVAPAVVRAISLIRRNRMGLIMTSCPPYSVHVIGLAVKRLTGVRWIADFRDPWMTTGSKRLFPTSALSLRVERWLERRVVQEADLVVFNVERLRNAYRNRYRDVSPDKLVFIPNAVSSTEARRRPTVPRYETFTLTYTGSLYLGRSPEPVFKAVARLVAEQRIRPEAVRVLLVGQCDTIEGVPTVQVARQYGLERQVEIRGAVPYEQAIEMVSRSHLALLFAPDLPFQIPAKVYDYLATGARILAIADDGGTADLVRDTGCGRAFSTHDVDAIAEFIESEMHRERDVEGEDAPWLARFDLQTLTAELVEHMSRVGTEAEVAG